MAAVSELDLLAAVAWSTPGAAQGPPAPATPGSGVGATVPRRDMLLLDGEEDYMSDCSRPRRTWSRAAAARRSCASMPSSRPTRATAPPRRQRDRAVARRPKELADDSRRPRTRWRASCPCTCRTWARSPSTITRRSPSHGCLAAVLAADTRGEPAARGVYRPRAVPHALDRLLGRAGCGNADQMPPERVPAGHRCSRRATRFEPPTRAAAAASVPRRPSRQRFALPELLYLLRRLGALARFQQPACARHRRDRRALRAAAVDRRVDARL